MSWITETADVVTRDVYTDIAAVLNSRVLPVDAELRQLYARRGKGARPMLTALTASLTGGSWQDVRRAAMVVETVHIASLIQDDVVDGSILRRGGETLNARYSDLTSVLFGDLVFIKGLAEAQSFGNAEAVNILYRAVERMIEGELAEALAATDIDESGCLVIIADKTASLFSAAAQLGALLSGADERTATSAADAGEAVGMAFQLVDDTLDFIGESEVMGKPRHVDAHGGTITLPVVHALATVPADERLRLVSGGKGTVSEIAALVQQTGGIEYTMSRAGSYADAARQHVETFADTAGMAAFDAYVTMVMDREH
jgi:octaprenyl-diphosphate synthase